MPFNKRYLVGFIVLLFLASGIYSYLNSFDYRAEKSIKSWAKANVANPKFTDPLAIKFYKTGKKKKQSCEDNVAYCKFRIDIYENVFNIVELRFEFSNNGGDICFVGLSDKSFKKYDYNKISYVLSQFNLD